MQSIVPAIRLALLLLLAAPSAWALQSAPVTSPRASVSLVTDTDHAAAGQTLHIGLLFHLAPGWHTYWKNPGDAGVPAEIKLTLPPGATAGPIVWPAPHRVREGPLMTFAYTKQVLLPLAVTAGAAPLHIAAHADWLVCEKICVPEQGDFKIDIPAGPPGPSAEAPLFAAAAAQTPRPSPFAAAIAPDGTLTITGQGLAGDQVADTWLLPDAPGLIDQVAPQPIRRLPDGFSLHLTHVRAGAPLTGILVIADRAGQRTLLDVAARPAAAAAPALDGVAMPAGLPRALAFAFLGGLILNLMPCVFPVLAMKAVSLVRLSGRDRFAARAGALFYLAGVLVAFTVLGGLLVAARAAGGAAGWGAQFQSPVFVGGMAMLLFAIGLNLSGVFELGGNLTGAGQTLARRGGLLGSFFTGLLAVVVATPCTAPFMGAAIAAALAMSPAATMLVFVAMGLGLAAPYVALAMLPDLAHALPRPGRWMDVLRQALAFPMYAAAAWLVWVVSAESGSQGVLAVLAGLVMVALAAWALGLSASLGLGGRRAARAIAVFAALAALATLPGLHTGPVRTASLPSGTERYTPERLADLRARHRAVFVNMTADWCVTCLVNERVALAPAAVRDAMAAHKVTYLIGDWTRQDPAITSFLRAHGRDGVPLYLFYPPDAAAPVMLPQILTENRVLDEIDRVSTASR